MLIFDEVMTGFRVALGGANKVFDIKPDLICLGKVVGGGFPCAAFGGREDIMNYLAPNGPVYQAGTLSGNSVAMVAGLATLKLISKECFYQDLDKKTSYLVEEIKSVAKEYQIDLCGCSLGGMFGLFFSNKPVVQNYQDVSNCNMDNFKKFHHNCLQKGIYFAPSAFEAGFISSAHTYEDLDYTIKVVKDVFSNF